MSTIQELALNNREFKSVQSLIYDLAGIALADSKHIMVQSRLAKRVRKLELDSYTEYLRYLDNPEHKDEVTNFVNALTTNKTDFFREKHHFDFLANTAFPELKRRAELSGERKLRIWCSASSTGEEPYTIAMSIREFFGEDPRWDIRILASDIDTEVLARADEGVYDADRVGDIPTYLLKKYFEKQARGEDAPVKAKPTLRDLITFRKLNLQDQQWPINTSFDIIFCRNVMIYFDRPSQKKIVEHFADYLRPEGHLIIGHSEALFGITDRYRSLGDTIYQLPTANTSEAKPTRPSANRIATDMQAQKGVPALAQSTAKPANVKLASTATHHNQPDASADDPKRSIIIGEVFSSAEPVWITTLLGSCVAVCLYDEVARVGGMNHFMLPTPCDKSVTCASYGIHSMEMLINSVMNAGGDRRRLKAKVFGGGNVLQSSTHQAKIGSNNIDFALQFLSTENIPVMANFTGHDSGMHVKFHTHTNKVLVRMLDRQTAAKVQRKDAAQALIIQETLTKTNDITLF